MANDTTKTKSTVRDPKALTPEYHKAHKQLMLWSAILFIWELIGIDLEKAKDAGGNVGPVVTALKSPQAVPWALMGLVVYFVFKCSVEWSQCDVDRRRILFARIDFVSAIVVSGAAIMLYAVQSLSRVQVANLVAQQRHSVLLGAMLAFALGLAFVFLEFYKLKGPRTLLVIIAIMLVASIVVAVGLWIRGGLMLSVGIPSAVITLALFLLSFFLPRTADLLRRLRKRLLVYPYKSASK